MAPYSQGVGREPSPPRPHRRRQQGEHLRGAWGMNVLFDTNILLRMAQAGHAHHQISMNASVVIYRRGDTPCLVPQVLYEYWVVVTRPIAQNGLGWSAVEAASKLTQLQSLFTLLP